MFFHFSFIFSYVHVNIILKRKTIHDEIVKAVHLNIERFFRCLCFQFFPLFRFYILFHNAKSEDVEMKTFSVEKEKQAR